VKKAHYTVSLRPNAIKDSFKIHAVPLPLAPSIKVFLTFLQKSPTVSETGFEPSKNYFLCHILLITFETNVCWMYGEMVI